MATPARAGGAGIGPTSPFCPVRLFPGAEGRKTSDFAPSPTPPTDDDAELAAIRARKREALLSPRAPPPASPSGPVTASTATFDRLLREHPRTVVDFWAEWCGPCRQLSPTLDAVAREFAGAVQILKVNVDQEPELAARFGVQAIPTLLLFDRGQPVDRVVGLLAAAPLRERFGRAFGLAAPGGRVP